MEYTPLKYDPKAYEYSEVLEKARENYQGDFEKYIGEMILSINKKTSDVREQMMLLVKEIAQIARIEAPAMVFFYAPPYCPHNTLHKEIDKEKKILDDMRLVLQEVGKEEGVNYGICHFYPSLSDSSYLKIDDPETSIKALVNNFPNMKDYYPVPIDKISSLSIPALTIGTYGKDAHKWTERVHKGYTFGVLPKLIEKIIKYNLGA